MFKALALEIFSYYVNSRRERNICIYLSYFFASLGIILLGITNFAYSAVTKDTAFLLIMIISGCFGIAIIVYAIGYYIKRRSKYKILQPLLESYSLLEKIFSKIPTGTKGKDLNTYRSLIISGLVLCLATMVIYKYSKKITKTIPKV